MGALTGYRVLDLADAKGLLCTKLLADMGADVIKVERPEGDPARRIPPFKDDQPHPEKSLYFQYHNMNKRGITLNLDCHDGRDLFKSLVKLADVVVETFPPDYLRELGLDYPALKEVNPGLVMTSITGFGQTGPHKDYKAPDIVGLAMGAMMYFCGDPARPPCVAPGTLAYGTASVYGAIGTMLALYHRGLTGQGQHVDISLQESVAAITDFSIPRYSYEGHIMKRSRSHDLLAPYGIYPCKDGHVFLLALRRDHWEHLIEWMGQPEALKDEVWKDMPFRVANRDVIDPYIIEFTKQFNKVDFYLEAQRREVTVTPVNTPADFINSEQTLARELFLEVDHPELRRERWFGPPFKLSQTPWRLRRPAPLLGQYNQEVYMGELGLSKQQLVSLRAMGVI